MTVADLGLSGDELQSGVTIETLSLPRQERLTKILQGDTKTQVMELVSILREEKIGLF